MDSQILTWLSTQITSIGRSHNNLGLLVKELKDRNEMLSRMLSMHHFAILAMMDDAQMNSDLRKKIEEIAKRFKIKLRPTDPEYQP